MSYFESEWDPAYMAIRNMSQDDEMIEIQKMRKQGLRSAIKIT